MTFFLRAYSLLEPGRRERQEDCLYPLPSASPSQGPLYVLCDGMGGHAAGNVASQVVCGALVEKLEARPFSESLFREAMEAAYDALDREDVQEGTRRTMGTTLTLACFYWGGCFVAHIGDSRVYHIRPSSREILFVTRDHSLVNDLVSIGELTPEEARVSPQRNILTRAMQPHQDVRTRASVTLLTQFQAGDYLFLCSDGILEQLEDDALVELLATPVSEEEKMERLRALTAGNRDNHSAHLVLIEKVQ